MSSKVSPLAFNVPIVDDKGNPTPYFQRLIQQWLNEKAATDALADEALPNSASSGILLGRATAGDGEIEELSLSQALDLIGSAAQGDLLFRGAAGWQRLPAGTSGQFLKTLGVGADPAWGAASGGGGWTAYTVATAGDSFIDVNLGSDGGRYYDVLLRLVPSANADISLYLLDNGSVNAANRYKTNSSTSSTDIRIASSQGSARELSCRFAICNLNQPAGARATIGGTFVGCNDATTGLFGAFGAWPNSDTAIYNGFRLSCSAGNLDDAEILVSRIA